MKLYYHPASTVSRPVVMFIEDNAMPAELQVVDLFSGEHMQPAYAAINPSQLVPVLEDGDLGTAVGGKESQCDLNSMVVRRDPLSAYGSLRKAIPNPRSAGRLDKRGVTRRTGEGPTASRGQALRHFSVGPLHLYSSSFL